jgi:ketosteroid isomerase-like protein
MNAKLFTVVAISILIVACNETKVDVKAEEAAIMKIDSTWASLAIESKDVDKVVSYWADDAIVVPPGQPVVKGKDALRKMVEDSKNIPGFSITWKSSEIHFSSDGKMAYMSGENLVTMNDSTGNKLSIPGRGYTIWRKEADGDWKCVVDIWNNPPSEK